MYQGVSLEDIGILDSTVQEPSFSFESGISMEEKIRIRKEVRRLSLLNPVLSFSAIALNWLIIIVTVFAAYKTNNLYFSVLAIIVIGTRQHALGVLMHDGAHHRLARNKKLNLFISDTFCAFPILFATSKYADLHLAHHKYLNTNLDPDYQPQNKSGDISLSKKKTKYTFALLLRHMTGISVFDFFQLVLTYGVKTKTGRHTSLPVYYKIFRVLYYVVMVIGLTYFHLWAIYLIYWLLPAITVLTFINHIRSIAEHLDLPSDHELNSSRNVVANVFMRFMVPHSISYHLDHHLYPSVPFYNIRKLHKVLLKNPVYLARAINANGYF